MPNASQKSTPAAYGAAFELAGATIILTTTLRWLAVAAFVAGTACMAMGALASARR